MSKDQEALQSLIHSIEQNIQIFESGVSGHIRHPVTVTPFSWKLIAKAR